MFVHLFTLFLKYLHFYDLNLSWCFLRWCNTRYDYCVCMSLFSRWRRTCIDRYVRLPMFPLWRRTWIDHYVRMPMFPLALIITCTCECRCSIVHAVLAFNITYVRQFFHRACTTRIDHYILMSMFRRLRGTRIVITTLHLSLMNKYSNWPFHLHVNLHSLPLYAKLFDDK